MLLAISGRNLFNALSTIVILPKLTMAWRSSGSTNEELMSKLRANGVISSDKVEQVMKSVDRSEFSRSNPYTDAPQGIGYGVTISAPHMVSLQSAVCLHGSRKLSVARQTNS